MAFKLFKGRLDASEVFNTISNGVDKLAFTDQERAAMNLQIADKVAEYAKDTLAESTVRSYTRRFVSIAIVSVYLVLVLAAVVLSLFNAPNTANLLQFVTDSPLTTGFIMVLAFFYGGYYLKHINLKK